MSPKVTVMRQKNIAGWPDKYDRPGERTYARPLSVALPRKYTTDAHCTQYVSPHNRRLNKDAFDQGGQAEMTCMMFDIDDSKNHGKGAADEIWRADLRAKMAKLHDVHPDPYYYETRGGARFVYALEKPMLVKTVDDTRLWNQRYVVVMEYMRRRFDIHIDQACSHWNSLFRLPHATRDADVGPENHLVVGDPACIGVLSVRATPEDLEAAVEKTKAFREVRVCDFSVSDGRGLLYHALLNRGDVIKEASRGFFIRCPQNVQHSSGRVGDSSTVLYLPAAGERIGAIHCKHAHCVNMTVKDWLGCFTKEELRAAEKDAGLEK